MKCECGGKSSVTTTKQLSDGVFRRRKCDVCARCFATLESLASTAGSGRHSHDGTPRKPKPVPDARGIYTKTAAAEVKKQKVEARRRAEDRKAHIPNYFIEDEEDY